tara:strand:+ start:459 stop:1778 length:1320 start_codon:yes stop_codon:yes gene_type:complete
MQINLNNIACSLIILMPALLITGPFLSDTAVVLIDLIFIYFLFKEKKFELINNFTFKILIIFNVYICIRSIFADDILFSLKSSLPYFRFTILIFAVVFFLRKNDKLIQYFSIGILITILILCSDALFQFFFEFNSLGFKVENPDKINGLFGDEGVLGSYLIRFLPLFLACLLTIFRTKNKYLFIISFLYVGFLIFLSGSRSSIALYILFTFILLFFFSFYRKVILINTLILLSILTVLLIKYDFSSIDKNQYYENKLKYKIYYNLINPIKSIFFEKERTENLQNKKLIIFTRVYHTHYETAYNMFKENKVFGVGNKMYRRLCNDPKYYVNKYSCTTHPHNFYIQILAENGIIGFAFISSFFLYLCLQLYKELYFRIIKKKSNLNNKSLLIFIGIFLNFWPIIPSGNFYNNWISVLIYFPIAFYIFFKNQQESLETSSVK